MKAVIRGRLLQARSQRRQHPAEAGGRPWTGAPLHKEPAPPAVASDSRPRGLSWPWGALRQWPQDSHTPREHTHVLGYGSLTSDACEVAHAITVLQPGVGGQVARSPHSPRLPAAWLWLGWDRGVCAQRLTRVLASG